MHAKPLTVALVVALVPLGVLAAPATRAAVQSAGDTPGHWSGPLPDAGAIPDTQDARIAGAHIYQAACAVCHGVAGRGNGPAAALLPSRPRDFTQGQYKVRSTPSGELPLDEDLYRTISVGFPEYGMPRFAHLTPRERWSLVYYLKSLAPRFETETPEPPVAVTMLAPATHQGLARGREVYALYKCGECHGDTGRGDGPSAYTLKDNGGYPAYSRDFHLGTQAFKRGASARDILNTFRTGMDGSPMPSYLESIGEEDAAALAHYVEALSREP